MKTPNIMLKYEEESVKLKISAIRMDQEGVYKCVAKNSAGSAECIARIVVEGTLLSCMFFFIYILSTYGIYCLLC